MSKKRTVTKKQRKELIRVAEYFVSGGAWFWSGYAAFALLDAVLGVSFWPAKIGSYFIGASINFGLQRYWVFKQKKTSTSQVQDSAKRYYSLMVVNFLLDQAIVGGLRAVGLTPYIGQFISSGFFTVWNYLWYSLWVFKRQKAVKPRKPHAPALHRPRKAY